MHAERLEAPGVSGNDGLAGSVRDRSDEGVGVRGMFGHLVGGKDACGGQVEGQHPTIEGGQYAVLKPATQNLALLRVCSFLGDDTTLDLSDSARCYEELGEVGQARCFSVVALQLAPIVAIELVDIHYRQAHHR